MTYLRCTGPVMLFALAVPAWSQPPKASEVWGHIGVAHAAGDEGSIGNSLTYGAGVAVPLTRSLAVNFDVERMQAERFNRVTRVLVSPALVWRWGNERVYGFAGGGLGMQTDRFLGFHYNNVPGQQPAVTLVRFTETGVTLHGQVGVVFSPIRRLIVRAEFVSHWRYVMPTTGFRVGVGYRL